MEIICQSIRSLQITSRNKTTIMENSTKVYKDELRHTIADLSAF